MIISLLLLLAPFGDGDARARVPRKTHKCVSIEVDTNRNSECDVRGW